MSFEIKVVNDGVRFNINQDVHRGCNQNTWYYQNMYTLRCSKKYFRNYTAAIEEIASGDTNYEAAS